MYATLDDLKIALGVDRLLRIADRDRDDVVDAQVVDTAIERASAEIDAAIGQRYRLPLASVPLVVRDICIDLSHYILDLDPDEDLRSRAKAARKRLEDLRDGRTVLTDAATAGTTDDPAEGGRGSDLPRVRPFVSGLDLGGL